MAGDVIAVRLWIAFALCSLSAPAQPARIVSTFPSVTETLFALGAGDRVVGVSNYCRYPAAALSLPKIGTYMKPDPEKIALLRPDLVIIQRSATTLADRLSALHIQTAAVKLGSLAEIYSMILDIGRAIGAPEQAEKLNAEIRARLDRIRAASEGKPRPSVLILVGRNPGLLTNLVAAGPGSYLGELLEIAGGRNALTETPMNYPHISLETVLRLNPDIILDASGMGSAADPASLRTPWLSHPELNAVHHEQVFGLSSEPLVTPGPRVVDAVELLANTIHQKNHAP